MFTVIVAACVLAASGLMVSSRTASAVPAGPRSCADPLARTAAARSCIRFSAGYARFQTAMTSPNNVFEVSSDAGLEVIMFDDWVVISGTNGTKRRLVPRDRFVYAAEAKFDE
jgi:hypothetical protein